MKNPSVIPETAAEALRRLDAGEAVWTVTLGGFGPSYEQAVQILFFEMLRELIQSIDVSERQQRDVCRAVARRLDPQLRFSGAQVGQAQHFALMVMAQGYRKVINRLDDSDPDRAIQVTKAFPEWPR